MSIHYIASVVYPCDRELLLAATAQDHRKVSYHIEVAQKKIKI